MSDEPTQCPYCGGVLPASETVCPDCHEDLAALVRLRMEYAIYYNDALSLAREGYLEAARARLALSLERNPRFLPARRLLTKVCAALEDWPAARHSAARALELAPDDENVRRLVGEVEAAAQRAPQTRAAVSTGAMDGELGAALPASPAPTGSRKPGTSIWATLFSGRSHKLRG